MSPDITAETSPIPTFLPEALHIASGRSYEVTQGAAWLARVKGESPLRSMGIEASSSTRVYESAAAPIAYGLSIQALSPRDWTRRPLQEVKVLFALHAVGQLEVEEFPIAGAPAGSFRFHLSRHLDALFALKVPGSDLCLGYLLPGDVPLWIPALDRSRWGQIAFQDSTLEKVLCDERPTVGAVDKDAQIWPSLSWSKTKKWLNDGKQWETLSQNLSRWKGYPQCLFLDGVPQDTTRHAGQDLKDPRTWFPQPDAAAVARRSGFAFWHKNKIVAATGEGFFVNAKMKIVLDDALLEQSSFISLGSVTPGEIDDCHLFDAQRVPHVLNDMKGILLAPVDIQRAWDTGCEIRPVSVAHVMKDDRRAAAWSLKLTAHEKSAEMVLTTPINRLGIIAALLGPFQLWPRRPMPKDWKMYRAVSQQIPLDAAGTTHAAWKLGGDATHRKDFTYWSLDTFPIGATLHLGNVPAAGSVFVKTGNVVVGAEATVAATVAIDFGTTSSCFAFIRPGDGEPKVGEIGSDDCAQVFFDRPGVRAFWPLDPPGGNTVSSLLALRKDGVQQKDGGQQECDYHAVGLNGALAGLTKLGDEWEIMRPAKWSDEGVKAFLGRFLPIALAHVRSVAKIRNLVFTYPDRFSEPQRTSVEEAVKEILTSTLDTEGFGAVGVQPMSESAALARMFNPARLTNLVTLAIDLGGGTTDYAVATGADDSYCDSLRVGGDDILAYVSSDVKGKDRVTERINAYFERPIAAELVHQLGLKDFRDWFHALVGFSQDMGDRKLRAVNHPQAAPHEGIVREILNHLVSYGIQLTHATTGKKPDNVFLVGNGWKLGDWVGWMPTVSTESKPKTDLVLGAIRTAYLRQESSQAPAGVGCEYSDGQTKLPYQGPNAVKRLVIENIAPGPGILCRLTPPGPDDWIPVTLGSASYALVSGILSDPTQYQRKDGRVETPASLSMERLYHGFNDPLNPKLLLDGPKRTC